MDYEDAQKHCELIDKALVSDNFPSLRQVQLHCNLPVDFFPNLRLRGLLEGYFYVRTVSIGVTRLSLLIT